MLETGCAEDASAVVEGNELGELLEDGIFVCELGKRAEFVVGASGVGLAQNLGEVEILELIVGEVLEDLGSESIGRGLERPRRGQFSFVDAISKTDFAIHSHQSLYLFITFIAPSLSIHLLIKVLH